jgi:hypothetical protein|tara:strand:- start:534 stop:749 length:216 start_codon:yes stop_codon:yes gene_type:complete
MTEHIKTLIDSVARQLTTQSAKKSYTTLSSSGVSSINGAQDVGSRVETVNVVTSTEYAQNTVDNIVNGDKG